MINGGRTFQKEGIAVQSLRWEARVAGMPGMMEPVGEEARCGVWITRTLETMERTLDLHSVRDGKTLEE